MNSEKEKEKRFSFSTIEGFDSHISASIDGYATLHSAICTLSDSFIESDTNVYDIGCSTGTLLRELDARNELLNVKYIGIESEYNFIKDLTMPLTPFSRTKWIHAEVENVYLRKSNFITSVFTLQFILQRKRLSVLQQIYAGLNVGGAFVIAEKIRADNSLCQDLFTFAYYDFKAQKFSSDEILAKERDLHAILKPLTLEENVAMLKSVGFKVVTPFWMKWNFVALLCVK